MFRGRLVAIAIASQAKGPMEQVKSIEAVAGEGLKGDRYGAGIGAAQFRGNRKPENEVTLIAREAIDAANDEFNLTIEHLDTRRNLLTEGVPLNELIGRTFCVGTVVLKGLEYGPSVLRLVQRIRNTIAYLESLKPAQVDGSEEKTITWQTRSSSKSMPGLPYLMSHLLPNIHFHVTTAYAILRHNGVELGKKDYLGPT